MTTNLNPKYMIAPSLQEVFRAKDTGLPLRSGYVEFYKDQDRTTPNKVIYKLSGSPGAYTYTALPNPLDLTGIGTLSDGAGNDILPYYYPFDENGNAELYYIRVYSSTGVFQWDRQAFPNFTGGAGSGVDFTNYVPNGQFKQHNDVPLIVGSPAGTIADPSTSIAPGGWSFDRPVASTANQIITFVRSAVYTSDPSSSPRYQLNVNVVSPGIGDLFQDVRLKFDDVNKFQSTASPDEPDLVYTFAIEGQSNTGSNVVLSVVLIKNFGTGGSATTETSIGTITLTPSTSIQQISIDFGDNTGKTIGALGDDYLQIALRISNSAHNFKFTNAVLAPGDVTVTSFPTTTDADMRTRGIAGWMPTPAYDRSDLGLPLILSEQGLIFDHGEVGKIYTSLSDTLYGCLPCNGAQYDPNDYGSNGAPYTRLLNFLLQENVNGSLPFSPIDFLDIQNFEDRNYFIMNNSTPGAVTSCSDGAIPTGFTFQDICIGSNSYGIQSFLQENPPNSGTKTDFVIWNNSLGSVTDVGLGTSGFSITQNIRQGSSLTSQITQLRAIAAVSISPGDYFTFSTPSTNFYTWYTIDGVGADPAPGGTGIKVNLFSADSNEIVAIKTYDALNGFYSVSITTVAASSMTPGCYYNFNVIGGTTTAYYIWYKINGIGTDPAPAGRSGILVPLLSSDTQNDVHQKTVFSLVRRYFSVPDYRGLTLRGLDNYLNPKYDKGIRFNIQSGGCGLGPSGNVGTMELDSSLSHRHGLSGQPIPGTGLGEGASTLALGNTFSGYTGQQETVGYNAAVNFFIKY